MGAGRWSTPSSNVRWSRRTRTTTRLITVTQDLSSATSIQPHRGTPAAAGYHAGGASVSGDFPVLGIDVPLIPNRPIGFRRYRSGPVELSPDTQPEADDEARFRKGQSDWPAATSAVRRIGQSVGRTTSLGETRADCRRDRSAVRRIERCGLRRDRGAGPTARGGRT